MAKILVLGGTRFFGKRLVNRLVANGDAVTILTRGQHQDPFGGPFRGLPRIGKIRRA